MSKKKKVLLIIIGAALVLIAAAAALIIPRMLGSAEEKAEEAPAFYFEKGEKVSSVTAVVGERAFERLDPETLSDQVAEVTAGDEAEEAEEAAEIGTEVGDAAAGAAEAEETEEAAGTEAAEESAEAEEPTAEAFRYTGAEDIQADIDAYLDYLKAEKGFIDVTSVMEEREILAQEAPETASPPDKSEASDMEDGPTHYHLTSASKNGETSLLMAIIQEEDSYEIITNTVEQPWTQYVSSLWEERETQGVENSAPKDGGPSRSSLEEKLSEMTKEELDLPKDPSNYQFISRAGEIFLDGRSYAQVTAYEKNQAGTLDFVCTYLIDESGKVCYKYNEITGEKEPVG